MTDIAGHAAFKFSLSRHELALCGITVIWGLTFLIVQAAMQYSGPLFFVGLRFLIAGAVCLFLFNTTMKGLTLYELGAGSAIGVSIFIGYALQTHGLKTISSSQSAFITALYVPVVPLLQWLVLRRPPRLLSWAGIGLAFTGLLFLTRPEAGPFAFAFSAGEIATILGAFAMAGEIILIGGFAAKVDSRRVTVVQLLACGVLSLLLMPLAGEAPPSYSPIWLACAIGLGVASALIQLTMNWAQKAVTPTRATVIYAGEPVWAGIAGHIAGERLPLLGILGAVLIIGGVAASGWKPERSKPGIKRFDPAAFSSGEH